MKSEILKIKTCVPDDVRSFLYDRLFQHRFKNISLVIKLTRYEAEKHGIAIRCSDSSMRRVASKLCDIHKRAVKKRKLIIKAKFEEAVMTGLFERICVKCNYVFPYNCKVKKTELIAA